MKKTNANYTAKYAEKRQAKKVNIDLYLNDEIQKQIYEHIKAEPKGNVKKIILEYLKKHYGIE